MCVRVCVCVCVCVCISSIVFKNLCQYFLLFLDNIFHLNVHYVCMVVQCFEPQGRRFTNFHYDYYYDHYYLGPQCLKPFSIAFP